jgi:hypothetical protein
MPGALDRPWTNVDGAVDPSPIEWTPSVADDRDRDHRDRLGGMLVEAQSACPPITDFFDKSW